MDSSPPAAGGPGSGGGGAWSPQQQQQQQPPPMLQQQPTPYFSQQPGSMMPVLLPSQQLPNSPPQVVYMTQEQAMQQQMQMQMQQHTQHVPLQQQQQQQAQQYQLQQQLSMRPNQQQQAPQLRPPPVALPLVRAYQQVQPGDVQVELPAGEAASSGGANGSGGFNGNGGPAHGKASDVETPPPAGHGRLAGCCAQQRVACCPEGRKFGWPEFVAGMSGCGVAALGCVQYCWGNLAEPLLVESVSPRLRRLAAKQKQLKAGGVDRGSEGLPAKKRISFFIRAWQVATMVLLLALLATILIAWGIHTKFCDDVNGFLPVAELFRVDPESRTSVQCAPVEVPLDIFLDPGAVQPFSVNGTFASPLASVLLATFTHTNWLLMGAATQFSLLPALPAWHCLGRSRAWMVDSDVSGYISSAKDLQSALVDRDRGAIKKLSVVYGRFWSRVQRCMLTQIELSDNLTAVPSKAAGDIASRLAALGLTELAKSFSGMSAGLRGRDTACNRDGAVSTGAITSWPTLGQDLLSCVGRSGMLTAAGSGGQQEKYSVFMPNVFASDPSLLLTPPNGTSADYDYYGGDYSSYSTPDYTFDGFDGGLTAPDAPNAPPSPPGFMRSPQPPLPPLDTRQSAGWNNSRVDFVYDFPMITVDSGLATDSLKFLSKLDNNTGVSYNEYPGAFYLATDPAANAKDRDAIAKFNDKHRSQGYAKLKVRVNMTKVVKQQRDTRDGNLLPWDRVAYFTVNSAEVAIVDGRVKHFDLGLDVQDSGFGSSAIDAADKALSSKTKKVPDFWQVTQFCRLTVDYNRTGIASGYFQDEYHDVNGFSATTECCQKTSDRDQICVRRVERVNETEHLTALDYSAQGVWELTPDPDKIWFPPEEAKRLVGKYKVLKGDIWSTPSAAYLLLKLAYAPGSYAGLKSVPVGVGTTLTPSEIAAEVLSYLGEVAVNIGDRLKLLRQQAASGASTSSSSGSGASGSGAPATANELAQREIRSLAEGLQTSLYITGLFCVTTVCPPVISALGSALGYWFLMLAGAVIVVVPLFLTYLAIRQARYQNALKNTELDKGEPEHKIDWLYFFCGWAAVWPWCCCYREEDHLPASQAGKDAEDGSSDVYDSEMAPTCWRSTLTVVREVIDVNDMQQDEIDELKEQVKQLQGRWKIQRQPPEQQEMQEEAGPQEAQQEAQQGAAGQPEPSAGADAGEEEVFAEPQAGEEEHHSAGSAFEAKQQAPPPPPQQQGQSPKQHSKGD